MRVANNGISAVVDAYGRIVGRLGLNEVGVLDSPLPRPLEKITLYARFGNWMALISALVVAFYGLILRRFMA